MSKPSPKHCVVLLQHGVHSARIARCGAAPLINLWVHEDGQGGKGMYLDVEQATELVEGLNDILDEIEAEERNSCSNEIRGVG